MRIQESDIRLSSQHERDYRHEVETKGTTTFRNVLQEVSGTQAGESEGRKERVARMLQSLVDAIMAAMDGKKCRTEIADCKELPELTELPQASRPVREVEWKWEATERIHEYERTQVEGSGVIKTQDGRTIDFKMSLDMCREFSCERTYKESGKAVLHDPLVINFGGKAAELTEDRIEFDLDIDGKAEKIAGLGAGSGYLVLDRNGNGKVDNGGELFGARTGNGFDELAKLDSDGNGWLDEADPGFKDLLLWQGGKEKNALEKLADRGVGALWLGSVDSSFALKDQANELLGEIRASGLYLAEDGRVGSLQQVDLAVEPEERAAVA
jgi:hypothetical protein